jgi:hypothetical protein
MVLAPFVDMANHRPDALGQLSFDLAGLALDHPHRGEFDDMAEAEAEAAGMREVR